MAFARDFSTTNAEYGGGVEFGDRDEQLRNSTATAFARTQQRETDFDDEQEDELLWREQQQQQQQHHQQQDTQQQQQQWLETSDARFPQYQRRPPSASTAPVQARGARLQHSGPVRSGGRSFIAPTGAELESVYAAGHSDPSVAPTYSEDHGMQLYNPNEISWAGDVPHADKRGLRMRRQEGEEQMWRAEEQEQEHDYEQPQQQQQQQSSEFDDDINAELQDATEGSQQYLSPQAQLTHRSSRPSSRTGQRSGRSSPHHPAQVVPLESTDPRFEIVFAEARPSDPSVAPIYSPEHGMHLYNPNAVSWAGGGAPPVDKQGLRPRTANSSLRAHPPTGSRAASRPSSRPHSRQQVHRDDDPSYADADFPQYDASEEQLPQLLGAGDEQDAVDLDPAEGYRQSLSPPIAAAPQRTAPLKAQSRSPQPPQQEQEGEEIEPSEGYQMRAPRSQQQQQQQRTQPLPAHSQQQQHAFAISAPQVRSQVYIDEHGNRVARRVAVAAPPHAAALPAVRINPATGLPFPVYDTQLGAHLYIPSELSWANNVAPEPDGQEFDRGFRQQPNGEHTMQQRHYELQQQRAQHSGQHQSNPGSPAFRSTLGERVQVGFELQEVGSSASDTSFSPRPSSALRLPHTAMASLSLESANGNRTSRSASPAIVTARAAPNSARSSGAMRTARLASDLLASGSEVEPVYAEPVPSDPTVAPTWSMDAGMNLYNPNEVAWAGGGAPPADKRGLKKKQGASSVVSPSSGSRTPTHMLTANHAPVRAVHNTSGVSSSRPGTAGGGSPMPRKLTPLTHSTPLSPVSSQVSPTTEGGPRRFRRQPSGDAQMVRPGGVPASAAFTVARPASRGSPSLSSPVSSRPVSRGGRSATPEGRARLAPQGQSPLTPMGMRERHEGEHDAASSPSHTLTPPSARREGVPAKLGRSPRLDHMHSAEPATPDTNRSPSSLVPRPPSAARSPAAAAASASASPASASSPEAPRKYPKAVRMDF